MSFIVEIKSNNPQLSEHLLSILNVVKNLSLG